jgi:simple sugar transport system ATP-binding protein
MSSGGTVMSTSPILRMQGICKSFGPGIIAADNVDFIVEAGEIHALAGENGAGKTTLMRILYGMEKAQQGAIFIRDRRVDIANPNDAMASGVGMVHQHFMLVDDLTVAENVYLGIEPRRHGLLDRKAERIAVEAMAERYDMPVDPDAFVRDLSVANKQKVEILKVLARNAEIIILDEPTAVLTPQETKRFFEQLAALRKAGRTIIVITHKLSEIKTICDRITIMRKGRVVGTHDVSSISEEDISRLMIGSDPLPETVPAVATPGETILAVSHLSCGGNRDKPLLDDVSFTIGEGELLGVIGVEGNGQRELVDTMTGRLSAYRGTVSIAGVDIRRLSIGAIRALGLAFIPEDRMVDGVDLKASIQDNAAAAVYDDRAFGRGPFLLRGRLSAYARRIVGDYDVRCDATSESIRNLSGGNMQKVICGREISACGKLLIADQPTRGVDVGSMRTIHDRIETLRREGRAILLVSSDLAEIRTICRRAIILHRGRIVARIDDLRTCSEEELGQYMLGIRIQSGEEAVS